MEISSITHFTISFKMELKAHMSIFGEFSKNGTLYIMGNPHHGILYSGKLKMEFPVVSKLIFYIFSAPGVHNSTVLAQISHYWKAASNLEFTKHALQASENRFAAQCGLQGCRQCCYCQLFVRDCIQKRDSWHDDT